MQCKHCERELFQKAKNQLFCNVTCRTRWHSKHNRNRNPNPTIEASMMSQRGKVYRKITLARVWNKTNANPADLESDDF
jgi:hypothetical protein